MDKHIHKAKTQKDNTVKCSLCGLHIGRIIYDYINPYPSFSWRVREELPLKEGQPINYDRMVPGGIIYK